MKRPLTEDEIKLIREIAGSKHFYEALGIPADSDRSAVENAYRIYVREWHPDRFFSRDPGDLAGIIEANFIEVTRAYDTLRDDRKRHQYDQELLQSGAFPAIRPGTPRLGAPRTAPRTAPSVPSTGLSSQRNTLPPEVEADAYEVSIRPGGTAVRMPGMNTPVVPVGSATQPAGPAPVPEPYRTISPMAAAIARMKQQAADQMGKAGTFYQQGKADLEAGRFSKAEGSLYLALKIVPNNKEIQDLLQRAVAGARQQRAVILVAQAEQEEQYGRPKEALVLYEKVVELDHTDGKPFYQLARLRKAAGEHDSPKELMQLYKKAVTRSPKIAAFRLALAEMYAVLDMTANAHREAQAALELEPKNEAARVLAWKTRS
jgi:tetratricopeptide (TPR) repeat protein